jgi:hypothetical protein
MRKLEALKARGVQREEKKKKQMRFVSWKAFVFFLLFFSLLIFLCISKMIS